MSSDPPIQEWQGLPLILLSKQPPESFLSNWASAINIFSRTRQAEIKWAVHDPVPPMGDSLDTFDVCEDFLACLERQPNRRIVWVGNYVRDHPAMDRVLSSKLWLWISFTQDIEFYRTFVEFFLEGLLSSEAILQHNRNVMVTKLVKHRYATERRLLNSVMAMNPPAEVWQMPPVPTHRRELPLILQDIDGCLLFPLTDDRRHNPDVMSKLNHWSRSRQAEIRWMTYWRDAAVTKFAPSVALDTFAHGRDVYDENPRKEVQVLRWIDRNPDRKIVWIDDAIHAYLTQYADVCPENRLKVQRLVQHPQLLMVQPNATIGMSTEDVGLVDAFLAGHLTPTAAYWSTTIAY